MRSRRPDQARAVLAYSAALAEADSVDDVIGVVATLVLPAFGAAGVLVSLLDGSRLKLSGHAGYPPEAVRCSAVSASTTTTRSRAPCVAGSRCSCRRGTRTSDCSRTGSR